MKLCGEELRVLEVLDLRQHRIYPDACDYGLTFEEYNRDEFKNTMREMMETLQYTSNKWHTGKSVDMFLPIEYDGANVVGLNIHVSTNLDRKVPGGGFISIDITRASRPRT